MTQLVLGANTVINQPHCRVAFSVSNDHQTQQFGNQLGMFWLPLDGNRQAASSLAYLHEPKAWATVDNKEAPTQWQLDLPALFDNGSNGSKVQYLQLVAYTYDMSEYNLPAVEIDQLELTINDDTHYQFQSLERHVKLAIVLEIYQRNGQYKCRALGETSTRGVESLAQRVGVSIDTRPPATHAAIQAAQSEQQEHQPNDGNRPPRQVQAGEAWTGTAFAIDPYHLLTCYHVIESASILGVRQQGEADREAQVVMSDVGSDTAIIKVSEPLPSYLRLATQSDDILGETITTLGFPLSGINSQLQVTQGCISSLTGFNNDIRFMQFTAPIQPGSSGSPLLLPNGHVVGMVTASLSQAQNMNYAVKYQLLSALLSSAGISLAHLEDTSNSSQPASGALDSGNNQVANMNNQTSNVPLTTPQLSRLSRGALWMVGAQA